MKKCSKCKIEKPLSDYHKRSNRPCGVRSQCKECYLLYPKESKRRDGYMRDFNLLKYGIDFTDYTKIFNKQNGCCKICNKHISEVNKGHKKSLCVDHCHDTNIVRGLLCDKCNRGLGLFNDNIEILKKAIEYLRPFKPHV
jgi:hypothetical protein